MNDTSTYLLKVLRGFVQEEDPGPFAGSWPALKLLADMHSVTGILGHSVMSWPHEDSAPYAQLLRGVCLQTMARFSRRAEALSCLCGQLTAEGIDHLLIKGSVVRDYYPIPELRTFSDVDFLIRPEDRQRCDAFMKAQGFEVKVDWEPVFAYVRDPEFYEIHTKLLEKDLPEHADWNGYFSHAWDHAILRSGCTYELRPEFHLLYLLVHIAKHISTSAGAGIRMYLDIASFLRHFGSDADWAWFCAETEKLRFTDFANTVFTLVQREFGVESPIALKPVDDAVYADFMSFTMAGGTFGKFGRDPAVIQMRRQTQSGEEASRARTLIRRLFPSAATIARRYTYLQGRSWLLPVAWAHRILRSRETWSEHAQEAQGILHAETSEADRILRLYREIGL